MGILPKGLTEKFSKGQKLEPFLRRERVPLFKINLLIVKGEDVKLPAKIFRWILSSGRYIVIIVELIVIGAFVARYKLDADLASLKEDIDNRIPYLKSLKDDEDAIRLTQFRLNSVARVRSENPDFVSVFQRIAAVTPQNTRMHNITVTRIPNSAQFNIVLTGQTPFNNELSAFMNALRSDTAFSGIILTNISFEGQTVFTINGAFSVKSVKDVNG